MCRTTAGAQHGKPKVNQNEMKTTNWVRMSPHLAHAQVGDALCGAGGVHCGGRLALLRPVRRRLVELAGPRLRMHFMHHQLLWLHKEARTSRDTQEAELGQT